MLSSLGLIVPRGSHPEVRYAFNHALTQDVAYGSLLLQQRKVIHRAVAEATEDVHQERLAEYYEYLAHHYEQGETWDKALDYLLKAAEKSMGGFAPVDSIHDYTRALEVLGKTGSEERQVFIRIHGGRGTAYS